PVRGKRILTWGQVFPNTDRTGQFLYLRGKTFNRYYSLVPYFFQSAFKMVPWGLTGTWRAPIIFGDLYMNQFIAYGKNRFFDIGLLYGHVESVQKHLGLAVVNILDKPHNILCRIYQIGLESVKGFKGNVQILFFGHS